MLKTCAALLLGLPGFALFLAAQQPVCPVCEPSLDTSDPLTLLREGNLRYTGDPTRPPDPKHLHQSVSCGREMAGCQKPFAVILSCSDSRVPPEVIFDLGVGDLFVVREAGNVATPGVLGSIEYAVDPSHFGSKLVVVLGHKRCGAVEAAFCPMPDPQIRTLWRLIRPSVPPDWYLPCKPKPFNVPPEQWDRVVRRNVDQMAKIVAADLVGKPGGKDVTVVRAYYDLDDGRVELPQKTVK